MPARRRRSVVAWSVFLSALVHLGLAALLERKHTPPPKPPVATQIELEVVERAPPPPRTVAVAPVSPPVKSPSPHVQRRAHVAAAPKPVAPEPAPEPAPHVPEPAKKPAPDLSRAAIAEASQSDAFIVEQPAPKPRPEREITAPERIEDPNERTRAMIAEGLGRDRVARGAIDPYFTRVGQSLAKNWKPSGKVRPDTLVDNTAQLGENLALGLRAWHKIAEQYAKTGTLGTPDAQSMGGSLTPIQEMGELRERFLDTYRQVNQTVVRITQGKGGLLQHVELVHASNDPVLDAQVLAELRSGAMQLPVPPAQGLGISSSIRSVWSFTLVVSISPPMPSAIVTGSFDEVEGGLDVRLPLDRRIYKYVQLLSVE